MLQTPDPPVETANGEKLGQRKRRTSVRTANCATTPKVKRRKGERIITDELVPVVPVSDAPDGSGAASLIDYASLCELIYPAYLERIKAAEIQIRNAVQARGTLSATPKPREGWPRKQPGDGSNGHVLRQ